MADNLLEKASILLTPTAYNDGSMLSIKPENGDGDFDFTRGSAATRVNAQGLVENVQIISSELVSNGDFSQEGSELVTNGDFSDGFNGWTLGSEGGSTGWGIVDNKAVQNESFTPNRGLFLFSITEVGKQYRITMDVTSSDNFIVYSGATIVETIPSGTNIEYTFDFTSVDTFLQFRGGTSDFSELDNVSVKEVGQDWTFGTGFSVDQANSRAEATDAPFGSQLIDSTTLVASKKYSVSFVISNYIQGSVRVAVGNIFSDEVSSNGNFTFILTTANTNAFKVQARGGGSGTTLSVSNVSVKEITDDTNIPRIDYTDGCGSWLLEPQSTNLITYSEDFSNAYWTKQNSATITSNSITSPNGAIDADLLNCPTNGRILASTSVTSGVNYTFSIFIKKGTSSLLSIDLYDGGSNTLIYNFDTDVVSGSITDSSVEDYGNGWHRLSGAITTASTTLSCFIYGNGGYSENEANTYIWGAQLEEQSYATSYIPTNGSIATRLADVANNSGNSSLINSTEGVLYAEIAALADDGTNRYITIDDGSNWLNGDIELSYATNSNRIEARYRNGTSTEARITYTLSDSTIFNKIAFKWKQDDFALWVNGVEVGTVADGDVMTPNIFSRLQFERDNASNFYGKAKAVAVFPILTDAELQSLTTQ